MNIEKINCGSHVELAAAEEGCGMNVRDAMTMTSRVPCSGGCGDLADPGETMCVFCRVSSETPGRRLGHREMRLESEAQAADPARNPERLSDLMARVPREHVGMHELQDASWLRVLGLGMRAAAVWVLWTVLAALVVLLAWATRTRLEVPVPTGVRPVSVGMAAAGIGIPLGLLASWLAVVLR